MTGPSRLRLPRLGSGLAVALGGVLLIGGGLLAADAFQASRQPLPYAYTTTKDEAPESARQMAGMVEGAAAQAIELRSVDQGRLLASGQVLALPDGKDILVGWRSEVGEPLLRSDISADEEEKLVAALRKHLPAGSTVYAMPALSRRLAAMTGAAMTGAAMTGCCLTTGRRRRSASAPSASPRHLKPGTGTGRPCRREPSSSGSPGGRYGRRACPASPTGRAGAR